MHSGDHVVSIKYAISIKLLYVPTWEGFSEYTLHKYRLCAQLIVLNMYNKFSSRNLRFVIYTIHTIAIIIWESENIYNILILNILHILIWFILFVITQNRFFELCNFWNKRGDIFKISFYLYKFYFIERALQFIINIRILPIFGLIAELKQIVTWAQKIISRWLCTYLFDRILATACSRTIESSRKEKSSE